MQIQDIKIQIDNNEKQRVKEYLFLGANLNHIVYKINNLLPLYLMDHKALLILNGLLIN